MLHTILLVDDEEGIRKILGLSLRDLGYTVYTAASGEEGIELFNKYEPEIVLTDIKMPGITGLDLLEKFKFQAPDTEVIMITGHGDMNLAIQSIKRNATDFITKPINEDALEIALKRAHERIDMRRQLNQYTCDLERLVDEQATQIVEQERQLAALQIAEGFADGLRTIVNLIDGGASMFNQLPCFVSVHNANSEIISTNPLFTERIGPSTGKPSWWAYKGDTIRRPDSSPVERVLLSGDAQSSQEIITDKKGNKLPVQVNAVPILANDGTIELVLELAADMTEIQSMQEELRITRHRYQQLFEESPCYISVQNRELKIIANNRRFREDFGSSLGKSCHKLYAHRDTPCNQCPVMKTFEDGKTHQYETVITTQAGEQRNVLIWTAPICDVEGNIAEVMEMSTDITQLRALQDRLSTLGLLLGSTAHGIKGLLTALDGGIYRLGSGIKMGKQERIEDSYNDLSHLIYRLRNMVLDILHYAKERSLNWEVILLPNFVHEIENIIRPKAEAKGVSFKCVAPEEGTIEADYGGLSSAIVNILENAVDSCEAAHSTAEYCVVFTVCTDGKAVDFTITDNGSGMSQETREKLFTLFFSSKGSAGTGIGLFVANQTVQQHGGTISVSSEQGEGSSFAIRMHTELPQHLKKELSEKHS
ncbi:response regulator [Halodesulfovibrio aestuarii]|uniref:histidine kinase n=1 Tax=Halodesulfovibrio aestuarii TaxID=126333 RepID=A0A8G2C843_9BACT|nr:response regulator [Halodesulfovibrio aestuarii]SHI75493.1 PAS domain S-box-containing protein [Halodesulfovibrio aestuarii]